MTSHKVDGLNNNLDIMVMDEPGHGNANHRYVISRSNKFVIADGPYCEIIFQNGPVTEEGPNGVSNEALLAVVEHRLKCFQSGDYSCRENAIALTKVQEAILWLHARTRDRIARGVEGKLEK